MIPAPKVLTPLETPKTPQGGGILRQFGGGATTITPTPKATAAPMIKIVEQTGLSILLKLLDTWHGTQEQAQQLAALQYTTGGYIIDPKHRDVIIEIIGMLNKSSFEHVMTFLAKAPNSEYILWDQSALDEGRTKVARELMIQQAEEVGVKGVGRCRYCQSTELVFAMKQLRSGDEPATIFVRCVLCNKQWRQ